jgi:hypothetical protein
MTLAIRYNCFICQMLIYILILHSLLLLVMSPNRQLIPLIGQLIWGSFLSFHFLISFIIYDGLMRINYLYKIILLQILRPRYLTAWRTKYMIGRGAGKFQAFA